MTPSPPGPASPGIANGQRRLLGRWWRRQSPARQDRFATLGPLASVLLFLAAIISAFWYLRNEEIERETEAVKRDTEIAQQQIRLRLIENQEQLVRMAREFVTKELDAGDFLPQAASFANDRPEVTQFVWLAADRRARARYSVQAERDDGAKPAAGALAKLPGRTETEWAFIAARDLRQPIYSRPFRDGSGTMVFQVLVPMLDRGQFSGALVADYSIDTLMRHQVPTEVTRRHTVAVIDERELTIASTVLPMPGNARVRAAILHDVPLAPAANGLVLRGSGYRSSVGLISNTLFWMVVEIGRASCRERV